jgi:hypothetical protein
MGVSNNASDVENWCLVSAVARECGAFVIMRRRGLLSTPDLIARLFGGFLAIEFMFKRPDLSFNFFDHVYIRRH